MKMRIISSIVMVLVVVPFVLIGDLPFAIFMSVLGLFSYYELIHTRELQKPFPLLLKIIAYGLVFCFSMYNFDSIEFISHFDYRVMSILLFIFLSPLVFLPQDKYDFNDAIFLIGTLLFIGLSFNLIVVTRNYDMMYIAYLFLITTVTDTFALITGSLIGKHKMSPKISPKKTIEGLIGGVLMGTIVSSSFYYTVINSNISLVFLIMTTLILCLVGQLGDLIFSSIKRHYDVKDFSNIIPGHGGLLDRFDSLIFVAFAFILLKGLL